MTNFSKAVVGAVAALAISASAAFATVPAQTSCNYVFNTNMRTGAVSSDVMNLQKLLNSDVRTQVAVSGAGSKGFETSRFGPATTAAVRKFQAANGVSPVSGFAGPLTRAVLNTVCNGSANPTSPVVSTGPVSVSAASAQPNSTLVAGQSGAKLGEFVFSGNGTVNSIEFMRTGVSSNNTLVNVYLYEGNTRLTDSSSVLTDGTIKFSTPWSVSGTRNITVRADILTGVSGQTVGVAVKSLTLAGASTSAMVSGVQSGLQGVANATLATAALTGSQVAAASINAGQMNTSVWSQTLNVGTRAVKLHGMTFKMIGSAQADALSNISLFVDGLKVGNSTTVGANGLVSFDMSSSPMLLNTGNRTVEVRADIIKGSFRNFQFSLENIADLRLEDRDISGVFISTTGSLPNTAGLITINAGNLTTALDPAYIATQVVGGATNVEIGRFQVKAFGEDVKITSLTVLPVLAGAMAPAAAGLNNLSLYVNGGQVGSSFNWASGSYTFNNLGSSVYVTAGTPVIISVKADLVTTGNTPYTAGVASVNLVLGTTNAQGLNSNQLTGTGAVTGKTLTITTGAANFGRTAGFNAQTINQNTANVKIGSFTMQASNADALRVTNLAVGLTVVGMPLTSVTNLTVKDGSTIIGTPIGNVSATNNFSANINVAAAGSKIFDVYADIGNAANTNSVTAAMTATYNGVTNTTSQSSANAGVAMTVNTAALVAGSPVVNSLPAAQYVVPGTRDIATFNIKSTNGASTINKITFDLSGVTGINSITVGGVTKGVITGATTTIVDGLTIDVPFNNSGVPVAVTVAYNAVGQNQTTTNQTNAIAISNVEYQSGNSTANAYLGSATSSLFTLVASMPTAVKGGTGLFLGTGSSAGLVKVGTYSVTANSAGDINLKTLPVNIGMPTGGTVSAVELRLGNTPIAGSCTASASSICTFTTVDRVSAGTTKIYDVFATYAGITTAGNASINAGAVGSFTWDDTNVAPGTLTGTLLQNYGN